MSEYQEEAGLHLAGVAFVGTLLPVSPLVYTYLLAIRIVPAEALAAVAALQSPLLALTVAGTGAGPGGAAGLLPAVLGAVLPLVPGPGADPPALRAGGDDHRELRGARDDGHAVAGDAAARFVAGGGDHSPVPAGEPVPWGLEGGKAAESSMVEASRPLTTEGEVGTLELDRGLVFKAGMPPLKTYLRPYFRDPELVRRTLLRYP